VNCLKHEYAKKKKNFEENFTDEITNANVVDKFRIVMFQYVVDQLIGNLINSFSTYMHIIADTQYLIPFFFFFFNQLYLEYCLSTLSDLVGLDHQKLIFEPQ
jgi:hypothetical protein